MIVYGMHNDAMGDEVIQIGETIFIPADEKLIAVAELLAILLQLEIITADDVIPLLDLANKQE